MGVVVGFSSLVLFPVAGYFAAFHGDWAYLYFVNWQNVPSAIDLALVLLAAALAPAGFAAAVLFIRARRSRASQAISVLVGLPVGLAAILAIVFARRLAVSASAAQYAGGFGVEPIATSALGKGVLCALLAVAGGAGWAVRTLRAPAGNA